MSENSYPRSYFDEVPPRVEIVVPTAEENPKAKRVSRSRLAGNTKRRRAELYANQEAKRAPKIQIDQRIVLWTWITGIGIAFVSSAIVSFNGITSVAEFVGLSADWMAALFFFFVELMYLLFLIAYLVLGSRLDEDGKPEKTMGAVVGMIGFAAIAVLANAFHTLDFWEWDWSEPRMWAGVVLAISAPIAIISASKMASRVVFAKAIRL
jgi:magnesium-transporting ATPase (P-type)